MESKQALDIMTKVLTAASKEFFETMCPLPFAIGDVAHQGDIETLSNKYELVGVVSFTGACRGAVSVHLTRGLAEKIAMTLLGLTEIGDPSDVFDTVGEVGNLVAGGGKTKASSAGLDFDISCPTVIKGDNYATVEPPKGSSYVLQYFSIADHPFVVMTYLVS